jgi:hypothetical protein
LEEDPKALAVEQFYKTKAEIEAAVYSIYAPLQESVYTRNYLVMNLSQTDYGYGRGTYASLTQFAGLDATNISRIAGMWNGFYLSIRNANIVIANAPQAVANGVNNADVDQLVAEARFLRAFNYFQLVINWAGVPLRTEINMSETDVPRSSIEDVYKLILNDLEFAEGTLPEKEPMAGRPSKWTAKILLADVYVNLKRWPDARSKTLEIITSNKYGLVGVSIADDFYKVFGPSVVTSAEEIFSIKYTSQKRGTFTVMLHHPNSPYNGGSGSFGVYTDSVKNKVIKAWDFNDLRKPFNLYNWNIGLGPTTMLYKKLINPDLTSGYDCDHPVYRYADVLLLYAEADCMANNGPTADGMEKLNMVRRRAYGKNPAIASVLDFKHTDYTTNTFIDLVLKERLYEFFCEGKRFYELNRTGRLKQVIKDVHGIDVADKHLLWPIPNVEYNYNKAINPITDQNPGY